MSDSSFPFEGQPSAPQMADPGVEPASNRGKLLALGGVAGALILVVGGYFVLFAGGGDGGQPSSPPKHVVAPQAPAPVESSAPVTQRINAKAFGRDPFKALIVEAPAATSSGSTSSSDGGGGTGVTTEPSSGDTTTGGTTTGGTTDVSTPTVTASHIFRVLKVAADHSKVSVRVDGHTYTGLKAGEVFATYFKVVVIGGKVNGFQFGDEKFSVFGSKRLYIAA